MEDVPTPPNEQDTQEAGNGEPSVFVYYKFRLTLDESTFEVGKRPLSSYTSTTRDWFSWLLEKQYINGKATAGCEVKGRMGDYVKPHFHIHFRSATKKDTIAQGLRRKYEKDYEEKLYGNSMYTLKLEADPMNDDKFFRYPLKQQDPDKPLMAIGIACQKTRDMCVAAIASYKVVCEVNQSKDMKIKLNESLYDRLEVYLDKNGCSIINILKFYTEDNKPINDATIVGYFNTYRLRRQIISYAEYASILKSKYNI